MLPHAARCRFAMQYIILARGEMRQDDDDFGCLQTQIYIHISFRFLAAADTKRAAKFNNNGEHAWYNVCLVWFEGNGDWKRGAIDDARTPVI